MTNSTNIKTDKEVSSIVKISNFTKLMINVRVNSLCKETLCFAYIILVKIQVNPINFLLPSSCTY